MKNFSLLKLDLNLVYVDCLKNQIQDEKFNNPFVGFLAMFSR